MRVFAVHCRDDNHCPQPIQVSLAWVSMQRDSTAVSGWTASGSLLAHVRDHRDELLAIAARYGVSNLRVFGSAVRGDEHPDSDVDLLFDPPPKFSLFDLVDLTHEVSELLGRQVELIPARSVHRYYKRYIFAEAQPL